MRGVARGEVHKINRVGLIEGECPPMQGDRLRGVVFNRRERRHNVQAGERDTR